MQDCTLHDAAQTYIEYLRTQGKKERTLYTYGQDFKQMEAFSISKLLEPIEDGTLHYDKVEILVYVDDICERIADLVVRLKLEVQL